MNAIYSVYRTSNVEVREVLQESEKFTCHISRRVPLLPLLNERTSSGDAIEQHPILFFAINFQRGMKE